MKSTARTSLPVLLALLLAGCVYAPPAPVMQHAYAFDRHPGVVMEVWWQYGYDGIGYATTVLVNRSNVPKCAWSDANNSRLLQPGESWQLGPGGSPGGVGVANVQPTDPACANAKRDYGTTRS